MSESQRNSNVHLELQTVFDRIDKEEKIDNWFKGILLFGIVGLVIFGSFVLLL